jgi:hypothetical protein
MQQNSDAPKTPIILDNKGDVTLFKTVQDAEQYVEAVDVEDDEYVGYDAHGYVLLLYTSGDRVHMTLKEPKQRQIEALERTLRSLLAAVGDPRAADQSFELPALIDICERFTYQPSSVREFLRAEWNALTARFFHKQRQSDNKPHTRK